MNIQRCNTCKEEKFVSSFYIINSKTQRRDPRCITCKPKPGKHVMKLRNIQQRLKYNNLWKNKDPHQSKLNKKCTVCFKEFNVLDFNINRANPDGLDYLCKKCDYDYDKNIRDKDPRRQLVYAAKNRALKAGLAFNITKEDVIIPDVCPVLGIKLVRGKGKLQDCSPTLDRTNPIKGYIKNNVQVISHRANTLKSNATIDELIKVLEYLKKC